MVGINFDRPVGPYADTKELEYVSALHQTCVPKLRQDGSIEAKDIMHFLRSRHGIQVDEDFIRQTIIMELCGSPELQPAEKSKSSDEDGSGALALKETTDASKDETAEGEEEEDPEPIMDIAQMLTLLLIPFLRSGNTDGTNQEAVSRAVELSLDSIWAELRSHSIDVQGSETDEGVLVTPDLLAEIFDIFGEFNVPKYVLHMMISAASGDENQEGDKPQFYLTKASFLQALTADTQLFDPNVDQVKSIHYKDALIASKDSLEAKEESPADNADDQEEKKPYKDMYMASHIDNTADNYRSTIWYALSWVAAVFIYLMYFTQTSVKLDQADMEELGCTCDDKDVEENFCTKQWGCDVARALINWSIVFIELMFLGFIWLFITNLGNANQPTETIIQKLFTTIRVALAMLLVIAGTQLTFYYEFDWGWINTTKTASQLFFIGGYYLVLISGCVILLTQLLRVAGMFVSCGYCTKGGAELREQKTKTAATNKIMQLVEHATLMHVPHTDVKKSFTASLSKSTVSDAVIDLSKKLHDSTMSPRSSSRGTGSSTSKVLLNYSHTEDTEETIGGVVWAWKKIFNGSLFYEEGIYLHGRLIAVNIVQFMVVGILVGMFAYVYIVLDELLSPQDDGCSVRLNGVIIASDGTTDSTTDAAERYLQQGNSTGAFAGDDDTFGLNENQTDTLAVGLEEALANNDTLALIANNDTVGALYSFVEDYVNYIYENAGELAGYDNWTITNWNINSTHFFDGYQLWEGQIPVWNETSNFTVCYDLYITNGTALAYNGASAFNEFIDALELSPWIYRLSASIGLLVALAAALTIAGVYIPSYVSSILKLRSGYDPSLKGNYLTFLMFRKSPDQCSILWGSAFWGILFSSGLSFAIFGVLTFIICWPITQPIVLNAIANYIGIVATMTLKILLMTCLRRCLFAGGFYRQRPASANMWSVIFEAQSLGTSIGTVTTRTLKLIVITIFFIGRIDTPMLAPGVGYVKGTPMDPAPNAFRKDLLIHEAHRHPYIERLGLLYLLKIFNRDSFGTRAGYYWRLLFTLALLPWMRKYRVSRGVPLSADEDVSDDGMDAKIKAIEEADGDDVPTDLPSRAMAAGNLWDRNDDIQTLAAKRRELKNQLKALNNVLSEKLRDSGPDKIGAMDRARLMESQRGDMSTASLMSC